MSSWANSPSPVTGDTGLTYGRGAESPDWDTSHWLSEADVFHRNKARNHASMYHQSYGESFARLIHGYEDGSSKNDAIHLAGGKEVKKRNPNVIDLNDTVPKSRDGQATSAMEATVWTGKAPSKHWKNAEAKRYLKEMEDARRRIGAQSLGAIALSDNHKDLSPLHQLLTKAKLNINELGTAYQHGPGPRILKPPGLTNDLRVKVQRAGTGNISNRNTDSETTLDTDNAVFSARYAIAHEKDIRLDAYIQGDTRELPPNVDEEEQAKVPALLRWNSSDRLDGSSLDASLAISNNSGEDSELMSGSVWSGTDGPSGKFPRMDSTAMLAAAAKNALERQSSVASLSMSGTEDHDGVPFTKSLSALEELENADDDGHGASGEDGSDGGPHQLDENPLDKAPPDIREDEDNRDSGNIHPLRKPSEIITEVETLATIHSPVTVDRRLSNTNIHDSPSGDQSSPSMVRRDVHYLNPHGSDNDFERVLLGSTSASRSERILLASPNVERSVLESPPTTMTKSKGVHFADTVTDDGGGDNNSGSEKGASSDDDDGDMPHRDARSGRHTVAGDYSGYSSSGKGNGPSGQWNRMNQKKYPMMFQCTDDIIFSRERKGMRKIRSRFPKIKSSMRSSTPSTRNTDYYINQLIPGLGLETHCDEDTIREILEEAKNVDVDQPRSSSVPPKLKFPSILSSSSQKSSPLKEQSSARDGPVQKSLDDIDFNRLHSVDTSDSEGNSYAMSRDSGSDVDPGTPHSGVKLRRRRKKKKHKPKPGETHPKGCKCDRCKSGVGMQSLDTHMLQTIAECEEQSHFTREEIYKLYISYAFCRYLDFEGFSLLPGGLNPPQFRQLMTNLTYEGWGWDEFFLERVYKYFNATKSGKMSFNEFLLTFDKLNHGGVEEKVNFILHVYDLRGEGCLYKDDMKAVCQMGDRSSLGEFVEEYITQSFERADADGNGSLDDEELAQLGTDDPTFFEFLGRGIFLLEPEHESMKKVQQGEPSDVFLNSTSKDEGFVLMRQDSKLSASGSRRGSVVSTISPIKGASPPLQPMNHRGLKKQPSRADFELEIARKDHEIMKKEASQQQERKLSRSFSVQSELTADLFAKGFKHASALVPQAMEGLTSKVFDDKYRARGLSVLSEIQSPSLSAKGSPQAPVLLRRISSQRSNTDRRSDKGSPSSSLRRVVMVESSEEEEDAKEETYESLMGENARRTKALLEALEQDSFRKEVMESIEESKLKNVEFEKQKSKFKQVDRHGQLVRPEVPHHELDFMLERLQSECKKRPVHL